MSLGCQGLLIWLCTPRAMGCAISACQVSLHKYQDEQGAPVSLLGSQVLFAMAGCIARYAYVTSTPKKPWTLGLQQDSLGRDISHMFLQFPAGGL